MHDQWGSSLTFIRSPLQVRRESTAMNDKPYSGLMLANETTSTLFTVQLGTGATTDKLCWTQTAGLRLFVSFWKKVTFEESRSADSFKSDSTLRYLKVVKMCLPDPGLPGSYNGRDRERGNGKESSRVDRIRLDAGSAPLSIIPPFVFLIRILNQTLPYTTTTPLAPFPKLCWW